MSEPRTPWSPMVGRDSLARRVGEGVGSEPIGADEASAPAYIARALR